MHSYMFYNNAVSLFACFYHQGQNGEHPHETSLQQQNLSWGYAFNIQ